MGKRSEVKDDDGNVTHVRITSDDGRTSELYEADNSILGTLLSDGTGKRVEVAEHHEDGTTDAYEADNSVLGTLITGGKGAKK